MSDHARDHVTPDSGSEPTDEATTPSSAPDTQRVDPLRGSRTSGFWAAVVGLGIVLLLLIIFIAQNTRSTTVTFLGWETEAPLAVALLIAAAAGLFLASVAGSLRILQLRRRVRRERRRG
jgi:uncharacterized integral membrane protein